MINRLFAGPMAVCGLLTMTMLFAAVAPVAATQSMFGETPEGGLAAVVVPTWGVLIGLMGALLVYGAFRAPWRKLRSSSRDRLCRVRARARRPLYQRRRHCGDRRQCHGHSVRRLPNIRQAGAGGLARCAGAAFT